jgi:hypothetical protein
MNVFYPVVSVFCYFFQDGCGVEFLYDVIIFLMIQESISRCFQVFKKIINRNNSTELRNIGSFLYKIKCRWENRIRNLSSELGSKSCSDKLGKIEYVY